MARDLSEGMELLGWGTVAEVEEFAGPLGRRMVRVICEGEFIDDDRRESRWDLDEALVIEPAPSEEVGS